MEKPAILADGVPFEMGMTIFYGPATGIRELKTDAAKHQLTYRQTGAGRWLLCEERPSNFVEKGNPRNWMITSIGEAYSSPSILKRAEISEAVFQIRDDSAFIEKMFANHGVPNERAATLAAEIQTRVEELWTIVKYDRKKD